MVNISPAAQFLNVILAILVVIAEIRQVQSNRKFWRWTVPVLMLMVHVLIYYAVYFIDRYSTLAINNTVEYYTTWSSVLRTHSLATYVLMEWTRAWVAKSHGKIR